MKLQLCRYQRPISSAELKSLLENPSKVATEAVGEEVDLGPVMAKFEAVLEDLQSGQVRSRTALDAELVEPVHTAMSGIDHRVACDMNMWHWMCVGPMKRFVFHRWLQGEDAGNVELGSAAAGRFLGSRSLNGMSRNAVGRLYWCGEQLHNEDCGYDLARKVISRQDFYQAIFERKLGNFRPAARACARLLADEPEDVWRNVAKRLNYELSTTVLEVATETQLTEMISEIRARVK